MTSEGALELDAPFGLGTIHLQHGDAHHENHDSSNQLENSWVIIGSQTHLVSLVNHAEDTKIALTLPKGLRLGPEITSFGEPDGDEGRTDSESDEETEESACEAQGLQESTCRQGRQCK